MNLYGLIGNPLSHSFSKEYFDNKFEKENIHECEYKLFQIENLNELQTLISNHPHLKGLNVTIPFKQQIINKLDYVDETARKIGAVNCIKIVEENKYPVLKGFNTDAFGFEASITPFLKSYHKNAIILGTGGSAKALAYVLDKLSIEYVFVSRNPYDCKHIRYKILHEKMMEEHPLIINATPVGMYPDVGFFPEIPYKYITEKHLLFDLIYNPAKTLFLKKGEEQGATIINGLKMLHLQADRAWEIWNT